MSRKAEDNPYEEPDPALLPSTSSNSGGNSQAQMSVLGVFQQLVYNFRLPLILAFNAALHFVSYFLALGLRFDFEVGYFYNTPNLWLPAAILITIRLAAYIHWELNQGYWKYASTDDLVRLIVAHSTASLFFLLTVLFLRIPGFPRSVAFIELALSILFAGGARLATRLFCEKFLSGVEEDLGKKREVLVLGAGDSGHLLVKNLKSNSRMYYKPVCVLDDTERMKGTFVHGVRVEGTLNQLAFFLDRYPNVSAVISAIPSLSQLKLDAIEGICRNKNVLFKKLQAFEDLAILDVSDDFDPFTIESLLEKEVDVEHEDEIREALTGKRILVTGAGGSIGSELVRQIIPFEPEKLIMLDHSEFNLFAINREVKEKFSEASTTAVLANITDPARIHAVFDEHKPEIVFHAAAYKHVPLMEDNVYEAFKNNILGTNNVLQAAHRVNAERFVMISTDKAVDPSSMMGASKRIAELLVQEYAQENPHGIQTAAVRFGNVINSAGSVIPTFKQQILSGGPVTVTHPDMERYFMSIREAVRLVLTAGTLGERGEIYMLDMGKPVKIVDVAKKMLALYGRNDIRIEFIGIRPGEKLSEALYGPLENCQGTRFRKISRVEGPRATNSVATTFDSAVLMQSSQEIRVLIRAFILSRDFDKPLNNTA